MTDIGPFLDTLVASILKEEILPEQLKKYLDQRTLSYSDVGSYIVPMLEFLSEVGMGSMKEGNSLNFFYIGEIMNVFLEKYFNQVQENGYFLDKKISILSDWFCKECWKFFEIDLKNRKCPHCHSVHTTYNGHLVYALYNHKIN